MEPFKILVKDLTEFIKKERVVYASGRGKRLLVALRAGPNVKRYVVEKGGEIRSFSNKGNAVRYFNNL